MTNDNRDSQDDRFSPDSSPAIGRRVGIGKTACLGALAASLSDRERAIWFDLKADREDTDTAGGEN